MADFMDPDEEHPDDELEGLGFFRMALENQGLISGQPTFKVAPQDMSLPATADRLCVIREVNGVRKRVLRVTGSDGTLQDRFVIEANINCGSFGKVKRGWDLFSGTSVAIKLMDRMHTKKSNSLESEVDGMLRVDSEFVVKCIGRYDGVLFPSLVHAKLRDYCILVME